MKKSSKIAARARVKRKAKARMHGKNRIVVFRSNKHMYAQLLDQSGRVITGVSTLSKAVKEKVKYTGNKEAAKQVGVAIGEKIKKLKLNKNLAFDRSGYIYHGRVAMVAEGMRSSKIDI